MRKCFFGQPVTKIAIKVSDIRWTLMKAPSSAFTKTGNIDF